MKVIALLMLTLLASCQAPLRTSLEWQHGMFERTDAMRDWLWP